MIGTVPGEDLDPLGHVLAHQLDQRDEDQVGEHAARDHDSGDAEPDDVPDAQKLGRNLTRHGTAVVDLLGEAVFGIGRPETEDPHEPGVEEPQAQTLEDHHPHPSATLAGDQHLGAGRTFRVLQVPVLAHDEIAAQRDHEQHAEPAAREGDPHDAPVARLEPEEHEGGEREHDACRDRLAGAPCRLDDVVFQDRRTAQGLENHDRKNGDRDRRRYREANLQGEVDGDRAEEQAEENAHKDCAWRELRRGLIRGDVRLESLRAALRHGAVAHRSSPVRPGRRWPEASEHRLE